MEVQQKIRMLDVMAALVGESDSIPGCHTVLTATQRICSPLFESFIDVDLGLHIISFFIINSSLDTFVSCPSFHAILMAIPCWDCCWVGHTNNYISMKYFIMLLESFDGSNFEIKYSKHHFVQMDYGSSSLFSLIHVKSTSSGYRWCYLPIPMVKFSCQGRSRVRKWKWLLTIRSICIYDVSGGSSNP